MEFKVGDCELWQPKVGEWCWFKDEKNTKGALVKILFISEDGKHYGITPSGFPDISTNLEPFIGELPSFLKDKQCGL